MILTTYKPGLSFSELKEASSDGVILGVEKFSSRSECMLDLQQLEQAAKEAGEAGLEVYLNLLKPAYEREMEELRELLKKSRDFIDGYYVSDEGILQLALDLEMMNQMIFTSETLITSALDAEFYLGLGVRAVSLAHDLSLDEILKMAAKTDPEKLELLIHGHFAYLESRRKLLDNYRAYSDQEFINKENKIRETTRDRWYPIIEDSQGTVVYSDVPKNSYDQLPELKKAGIKRFRIDGFLLDDSTLVNEINNYREILEGDEISESRKNGSDEVYSSRIVLRKNEEK